MITLKPFKAIRPPRDKAYLVATRSYLTYSDAELDDKLKNNPYTFLHVINPKDGRQLPFGYKKYEKVRKAFEGFEAEGTFMQDEEPHFYIYRQVKDGNEYIGLIGAVSVKDYLEGRVKKHEKTLTAREKMFTDYLEVTGFNAEPVLLTYQDDLKINQLFARYIETRAEYEFTSTDRVLHQLWLVDGKEDISLVEKRFAQQEALYIADGHHRSASSAALHKRMLAADRSTHGDAHFMAFLIGEGQMKVYEFNRLVKGYNGKHPAEVLSELQEHFIVEPKGEKAYKPDFWHEIAAYFNKQWYKLVPKTGSFDPQHPIEHLDTQILSKLILKPVLGIENLKTDNRISFLPGTESLEALQAKVDNGSCDFAFALHPTSIEQIKMVADKGKTMPPKSTYIEPKLRSGLLIYEIGS